MRKRNKTPRSDSKLTYQDVEYLLKVYRDDSIDEKGMLEILRDLGYTFKAKEGYGFKHMSQHVGAFLVSAYGRGEIEINFNYDVIAEHERQIKPSYSPYKTTTVFKK